MLDVRRSSDGFQERVPFSPKAIQSHDSADFHDAEPIPLASLIPGHTLGFYLRFCAQDKFGKEGMAWAI